MDTVTPTKNILLVEDEPLLGTLLKQRLEKEGFKVFLARDGSEGFHTLQTIPLDLVLLDIILPKISGFEFLEKAQADPQLQKVPIVIISNLGQETDLEKGQALGAVGYFVKARISMEELVDHIKEFLLSNQ
jgi:DNA-binding response OmpR family regulator